MLSFERNGIDFKLFRGTGGTRDWLLVRDGQIVASSQYRNDLIEAMKLGKYDPDYMGKNDDDPRKASNAN